MTQGSRANQQRCCISHNGSNSDVVSMTVAIVPRNSLRLWWLRSSAAAAGTSLATCKSETRSKAPVPGVCAAHARNQNRTLSAPKPSAFGSRDVAASHSDTAIGRSLYEGRWSHVGCGPGAEGDGHLAVESYIRSRTQCSGQHPLKQIIAGKNAKHCINMEKN